MFEEELFPRAVRLPVGPRGTRYVLNFSFFFLLVCARSASVDGQVCISLLFQRLDWVQTRTQ